MGYLEDYVNSQGFSLEKSDDYLMEIEKESNKRYEEVSQEGIGSTIKEWLVKFWEALKGFLSKVWNFLKKMYSWLGLQFDKLLSIFNKYKEVEDKIFHLAELEVLNKRISTKISNEADDEYTRWRDKKSAGYSDFDAHYSSVKSEIDTEIGAWIRTSLSRGKSMLVPKCKSDYHKSITTLENEMKNKSANLNFHKLTPVINAMCRSATKAISDITTIIKDSLAWMKDFVATVAKLSSLYTASFVKKIEDDNADTFINNDHKLNILT